MTIAPIPYSDEQDAAAEPATVPWTAEQARALRARCPQASPWRVLGWQLVVAICTALLIGGLGGRASWAWSAAYGALAVLVPSALFIRGVWRRRPSVQVGPMLARFVVWELLKVVLTVAMLAAAPRMVAGLNWLALLAGFVVTMKASWLALWLAQWRPKSLTGL